MIVNLKYGGKHIKLTPYLSKVEKEILLYNSLNSAEDDEREIDDLLDILKDNISIDTKDLSYDEKVAVLYKLRSISVGNEIDVGYTCASCNKYIETEIDVDNIIKDGSLKNYKEYELVEAFSEDLSKYVVNCDMDELDTDEYDELATYIKKHKVKFNFNVKSTCLSCKHINNVNIKDEPFLFDNMSEDIIANYYKNTSDMVLHGNYTKEDIDNMLPFERILFMSLLNQAIEERNK